MSTHILVTTDLSEESTKAFSFAKEQALRFGGENAKITLLCALEDAIATNVQFAFGFAVVDHQGVYERAFKEATKRVEELSSEHFDGCKVEAVVVPAGGPVHSAITEFANNEKADFIVLATHGRTGVSHALVGSVAERVIQHASCPVLVVPLREKIAA